MTTSIAPAAPPPPEPPPTTPRARTCAGCCATGSSTRRWSRSTPSDAPPSFIDVFSGTGMEEMVLNLRDMMPQGARRTKRRRLSVPEALEVLTDEEANKLIDLERLQKDAIRRAEQAGIIFIDEIDKVAGREGGRPRPRRLARGRAARSAADRRGLDGVDEVRAAQDRPRAVHRGRRVPRLEAEGPDPRAAGALPDPRRAGVAVGSGLRAHPDRARERADQAVHGAARRRRR